MKSENVLSFLSDLLKKTASVPTTTDTLFHGVKTLSNEMTKLSQCIINLSKMVAKHEEAIDQIYATQVMILKNMKTSSVDVLYGSNKEKSEKPN